MATLLFLAVVGIRKRSYHTIYIMIRQIALFKIKHVTKTDNKMPVCLTHTMQQCVQPCFAPECRQMDLLKTKIGT